MSIRLLFTMLTMRCQADWPGQPLTCHHVLLIWEGWPSDNESCLQGHITCLRRPPQLWVSLSLFLFSLYLSPGVPQGWGESYCESCSTQPLVYFICYIKSEWKKRKDSLWTDSRSVKDRLKDLLITLRTISQILLQQT